MINEYEWNRMMEGKLYSPFHVGDDSFERVHAAQKAFNESEYWHDKEAFEKLKKCFGSAPKDIPSHCVAAGNPCRVIRPITEKDRENWEKQYKEYMSGIQINGDA